MKKIVLDKDSNKILLVDGKELGNGLFEIISDEPEDVTKDALRAVFCWFENQDTKNLETKVSIEGSKYELVLRDRL